MRNQLFGGLLLLLLHTTISAAAEPAAWPHLRQLDVLAEQTERLVETNDVASLRALLPELAALAKLVAGDPLPGGAPEARRAEALQQDLRELATELSAGGLDDQQVMELAEGVHPIVAELMEAAGLPHVHDDEDEDDHDAHPHHDHERDADHHHAPAP